MVRLVSFDNVHVHDIAFVALIKIRRQIFDELFQRGINCYRVAVRTVEKQIVAVGFNIQDGTVVYSVVLLPVRNRFKIGVLLRYGVNGSFNCTEKLLIGHF